jgi:hypothetical protein
MLGDVWSDVGNVSFEHFIDRNSRKAWWFPHEQLNES